MLLKITAATTKPVSVERVKERFIIEHSDWDRDIDLLLAGAIGSVERKTGLALGPSTWEWQTDCWPFCGWYPPRFISIPLAPVRTIESVKYLDTDGTLQTVDAGDYTWDRTREGADVTFSTGWSMPSLYLNSQNLVRVRFTAGFDAPGGTASDSELTVPPEAELAVLFLMGHWLENREPVTEGRFEKLPLGFDMVADQLKIYR